MQTAEQQKTVSQKTGHQSLKNKNSKTSFTVFENQTNIFVVIIQNVTSVMMDWSTAYSHSRSHLGTFSLLPIPKLGVLFPFPLGIPFPFPWPSLD